jgi:RIC1
MISWRMKQTMLHQRKASIQYIQADFSEAQLPRVVSLLEHFPRDMLDVVVGCTRKTEVRLWHYLFQYVGRPKELFEQCMERGMLKSAGGYLLVLHTLEHLKDSSQVIPSFSKNKLTCCRIPSAFSQKLSAPEIGIYAKN